MPVKITAVKITAAAQTYLLARGATATLYYATRNGCCGGTVQLADASVGAPDDPEHYQVMDHEGVQVYLEPRLATALSQQSNPVTLDLEGFWRWRRLFVHDVALVLEK